MVLATMGTAFFMPGLMHGLSHVSPRCTKTCPSIARLSNNGSVGIIITSSIRGLWDWQSTSASNRGGWCVQALATYEKNRGVILVARSLHQDEHHREGETWMTSETGPSIRSIHVRHTRRQQPPLMSLSLRKSGMWTRADICQAWRWNAIDSARLSPLRPMPSFLNIALHHGCTTHRGRNYHRPPSTSI